MNKVDQTKFGDVGDCVRACVASILELPIDQVPHFLFNDKGEVNECGAYFRMDDWLKERGYVRRRFYCWNNWDQCLKPIGYHMMGGPSPRFKNLGHMVVGHEGRMVHDPHPSRDGLGGPPEEFEFIVRGKDGQTNDKNRRIEPRG